MLRDIYDYTNERNQESYIISIDFIKAYDSVDRDFLTRVLTKFGFQGKFFNIVKNLFNGTRAKILINGFITKTVKLKRGIKQGDALSLYLFLIALEPLMRAIEANNDIVGVWTTRGRVFKTIGFADDINSILGKGKFSANWLT